MLGTLFVIAALAGAYFALPRRGRQDVDRRIATLFAVLSAAGLFLVLGLGVVAMVFAVIGLASFFIGWQRDSVLDDARYPDEEAVPVSRILPGQAAALKVLKLTGQPTADEVIAAHRQAIRAVHPDRGGNAEEAARINAARDLLLKQS